MADGEDKCPICLDEVSPYDNATATRLPCAHLFHKNCINRWRKKKTCPVCRHPMNLQEDDNDCNDDNDEEEEQEEDDDDDEDEDEHDDDDDEDEDEDEHDDDDDDDDDDDEEEEEEEEEPLRRSIPRLDENNQHNDMHWPLHGEPSLLSSPQQDWSDHGNTHYPPYCPQMYNNVGVSYVPFAPPQGEWAEYANHSPISSLPWLSDNEPQRLLPLNQGLIVENHPQTSGIHVQVPHRRRNEDPMIMYFAVFLVFVFLYLFFDAVKNTNMVILGTKAVMVLFGTEAGVVVAVVSVIIFAILSSKAREEKAHSTNYVVF